MRVFSPVFIQPRFGAAWQLVEGRPWIAQVCHDGKNYDRQCPMDILNECPGRRIESRHQH